MTILRSLSPTLWNKSPFNLLNLFLLHGILLCITKECRDKRRTNPEKATQN